MTYFPDLTPYEFVKGWGKTENLLNVGWLDRGHSFPTAEPDHEIVLILEQFCKRPVNQTRGFHLCHLCTVEPSRQPTLVIDGRSIYLGSAEIRVPGETGIVYASPTLIYHYVKDHGYRPPDEFLQAVRASRP